ncbi:MAG TPA: tetratricopeptide repeat protein [Bacteroidia bacterium]|nr:tetratricopeptide repeat protein [Bacteroidia bacterium]HRG53898.1 tetratricopeptide repeat protein [Bacteroidia bacterium]
MIKKYIFLLFIALCWFLQSCSTNKNPDSVEKKNDSTTSVSIETLNQKILDNPKDPDLLHERAKYYLNKKDYQNCYVDMMNVLVLDSSKAPYFMTLSDLYFYTNKTRGSKRALEKAIELDDKNITALLKLAELYLYVGQNTQSIEYINKALKIDQYNAKAYFMKGMNYKDLKDTARAISSMRTAIEQDKNYYHAYMQVGLMFAARKDPLALDYYKSATHLAPNSSEAWYATGKFYQDVEDWDNAINTYNALATADAKNKSVRYNLGVIYLLNLKKYPLALEQFTQAIESDPDYLEAYYGRGITYKTMGNTSQAAADFEQCLRIDASYEPAKAELKQLNKLK